MNTCGTESPVFGFSTPRYEGHVLVLSWVLEHRTTSEPSTTSLTTGGGLRHHLSPVGGEEATVSRELSKTCLMTLDKYYKSHNAVRPP